MTTMFHHTELDNGLTIIGEENPKAHSVAMSFFVKTGSRDETADESGVSHFLEHMVFKGSKKRDALAVNRDLDKIGSSPNAFTSEELTVFYASCLPEFRTECLSILSDILRPALRSEDFDMEKKVILEEIGMYEDQPSDMIHDYSRKLYFGDHPLGNSVLGSVQSITALSRSQMIKYFHRRYVSGNIVLAVAGNFDFEKLAHEAEKLCSRWPAGSSPRSEIRQTAGTEGFEVRHDTRTNLEHVVITTQGPPASSPLRFAADLIAMVVGDSSGSRIYWDMVDPGHAESAGLYFREYEGTGVYSATYSCSPGKAQKNLSRVMAILTDIQKDGPTAAELEKARTKMLSRMVRSSEKPMSRMLSIGTQWTYLNKTLSVAEEMDKYRKVNDHQIRQVLDRYPLRQVSVEALGPLKTLKQS
ncbi:MAG: M16 family metallopeptidase [Planctomycetota bacterium]